MSPNDLFEIGGKKLKSRLFMGTARFPSPDIMKKSLEISKAEVITLSLRRESLGDKKGARFWDFIKDLDAHILPNTAGCKTVEEAVTTAEMAREIFETNWIKLEVIGDDYTLQPDPIQLVAAAEILNKKGFEVFPYTTEDLVIADKLLQAGCKLLMPWGSPIGSGRGLNNPYALEILRARFPKVPILIDAGIGKPSHAAAAMEMGFDGVLLNTAVSKAHDPIQMANAFRKSIEAGRSAFKAGIMPKRDFAEPSTPTLGTPFWHAE
ncbi:MAG: thiazole synthase [Alphaproteobacteria bacterium]